MIRIGSSCALSPSMALGKVVETRRFLGSFSAWKSTAQQAIQNKQYLIVTPCINRNDMSGHYPNDLEWIQFVTDTIFQLKSFGGNGNNSKISLVNEPMKFCTKEDYGHLISMAYPIVHKYGFKMGVGNNEFDSKGVPMYQYILTYFNNYFDEIHGHFQGICDTDAKTKQWANTMKGWADSHGKGVDCTEAFYADINSSSGWSLLNSQLYHAERIGCENFCNVFNNLDQSAFPWNTDNWKKLCFFVNGILRSNYWAQWKILMDTKGPVPNIKEVFEMYGVEINFVRPGSHNEETRAVQQVMLDEGYDLGSFGADSWYGDVTKEAIDKWQVDNGLMEDSIVGKETWQWIFENIDTGMLRFMQMIARTGRYK